MVHEILPKTPFPPPCVPTTTISIIPTTVLLLFILPAGFNLSRALLCELFQIQSMPASMAIEFCFHYAGFLGSFKLILILSSLLRPLKRAVFPPSLVNWDLSHFTRTAFSLARTACPSIPGPLCARPVGLQTSTLWAAPPLPPCALGKHTQPTAARSTPSEVWRTSAFKIHFTPCIVMCLLHPYWK